MIRAVKIAELGTMEPDKRTRVLTSLVRATREAPNGEVRQLEERIERFEREFDMSSHAMRHSLAQGEIRETTEVCEWLMLLDLRDRIASLSACSSQT